VVCVRGGGGGRVSAAARARGNARGATTGKTSSAHEKIKGVFSVFWFFRGRARDGWLFPRVGSARRTRRVASASLRAPRARASVASRATRARAVRPRGVATLASSTRRVRRARECGRDSSKSQRAFRNAASRKPARSGRATFPPRARRRGRTYLVMRDDPVVTLCAGWGGGRCGEWRRGGANAAFPTFIARPPADENGANAGILYGLRSCLKSRSPDVDGKREPWDARSARKNQPHTRVLFVSQPRVRDPLLAGEILGSDTCLLTRRPTVKRSNVDSPNERLGSTIGSASDSSSEGCEFDSCLGQFLHFCRIGG